MLNNIFNIILITFISFVPIVIWAYIFSYIDDNSLNKKRFFVGIIAGAISVFPILYMDKIISNLDFKYLNIFAFAHSISSLFSSFEFGFSMQIFLIILVFASLLLTIIFFRNFKNIKLVCKNIIIFTIFIFIISILIYFLSKVQFLDLKLNQSLKFSTFVFDSLKLVIFYYLIVAFLEETSKHFNFLSTDILKINSIKTGVLYAIFVALGFSFIENILYLKNIYFDSGFTYDLIQTYFFRSIFSVIVHILCSSVLAYFFMKAFLLYREEKLNFPYIKIFIIGLFSSIFLHLVFDVSLTLNLSFIIIIYTILAYLYIGSIFYKD